MIRFISGTSLRVGRSGVWIPALERDFSLLKQSDRLWGPRSPLFNGYRSYFPWIKRQGSDVEHSPPSRAQVKSDWSCTSATPRRVYASDQGVYV